jgi:Outer membrane efflux protein
MTEIKASGTKSCRSCHKTIDGRAMACRYCGAPQAFFLRRARTLNVLLIVALLIVSALQYASTWLLTVKHASDQLDRKVVDGLVREACAIHNVSEVEQAAEIMKRQFDFGVLSKMDVLNAEASLAQVKIEREQSTERVNQLWQQTFSF